jgi:C4-dicarboxylate transporter DctM subunit
VANTSITGLFLAGVLPGMMLTGLYIITAYIISRKHGFKGTGEKFSVVELLLSIWRGKWALLMPVIILGGIYGGIFTPTEAAEVGAIYAIFVGFVVTRKLTIRKLIDALIRTSAMAGTVTVLVGVSMTFSRLITLYRIPQAVGDFLYTISSNPTVILLMIAVVLFLAGFVADTIAMIVVLTPNWAFIPSTWEYYSSCAVKPGF